MRKLYLKTLVAIFFAALGSMEAWAAGYTRTLTEELTVAGYKAKTLYDFQKNDPEVLPTSGDLRYRDGGIWGLHNFGANPRSASVTIPVKEGDLLVLQEYNSTNYPATINVGTKNDALSTSTGYSCFEITSDADAITITTPRYGGIVAALLMEADNDVATADFTIQYVDEANATVQANKTETGVVGVAPMVSTANIWVDGVKYIYVSDDASTKTIASDGSTVVTITYRKAALYTLTVKDNWNNPVGTVTAYEGETAYVPYPRFKNVDGILYEKAAISQQYKFSSTLTGDKEETITYTANGVTGVVALAEGEDVTGLTAINSGTIDVRASNAYCGYNAGTEKVVLCTLPAGKYIITAHTVGNADASENWIMAGETQILNAKFTGNFGVFTSEEFELTETTDLAIGQFGTADGKGLDVFYVRQADVTQRLSSANLEGYKTFYNAEKNYKVDENTSIYTAVAGTEVITLTEAAGKVIPAGSPVILKTTAANHILTLTETDETATLSSNELKYAAADGAVTDARVLGYKAGEGYGIGFYTPATLEAGDIYIVAASATGKLRIVIEGEEATAIANVEAAKAESGATYNVAGQRVGANYKGIVIKNGKKMLVK